MSKYLKKFFEINLKTSRFSTILERRILSTTLSVTAEDRIKKVLDKSFPQAKSIEVVDVSDRVLGKGYTILWKYPLESHREWKSKTGLAEENEQSRNDGGCGAMYDIAIKAPQFNGLSMVKQHRLVTEALKEEIKDMHGLRIQTSPT